MLTADQRAAALADRFYFEACFDRDTSDEYIDGYFGDILDDGDAPSRESESAFAKTTRDGTYWGLPCYPLETFRSNASDGDVATVKAQGDNWLQWILARTHLRKDENVRHDQCAVVLCKLDWNGVPEFCLAIYRKTNQSGIWFAIPSIRYDWSYNTLCFVQSPTGEDVTDPKSYFTEPTFSDLSQAEAKRSRRGVWSKIIGSALGIGETACFGLKNGAFKGAGMQMVRGIYDATTAPKASALTDQVNELETFITETDEKLVISNVTSIIKERNQKIAEFMGFLEQLIRDADAKPASDPTKDSVDDDSAPLGEWLATFSDYTVGDPADQLQKALVDLTVNQYAGESFPVFLAGVNVHNLCWQYMHALEALLRADVQNRKNHVTSYVTEMSQQWIKLAARFAYESIDDRLRAQLKLLDDDRTIQDSYLDSNASISKKKKPFTDVSRYVNNCYGAWITENPGIPTQLAQLETSAHVIGSFLAITPVTAAEIADCKTIGYNNVAQTSDAVPSTSAWRDGRYVQYGIQFVYDDSLEDGRTTQSDIFWSPQAQVDHWIWPHLVHIPVCPRYSASARRLARRFGDMVDGAVQWESPTYIQVFDDSSSPRTTDHWDEAG